MRDFKQEEMRDLLEDIGCRLGFVLRNLEGDDMLHCTVKRIFDDVIVVEKLLLSEGKVYEE